MRSVLDVGCGAGHWGQRIGTLLEPGATITGVDHEEGFLAAARERAKRFEAHDFTYRQGDGAKLPFDDGSFDLVTCQTVLIHVADAKAVLPEMTRVAKPGGLVIAAEPNNIANAFMCRVGEPEFPFEDTLRLLRFERTCIVGKGIAARAPPCHHTRREYGYPMLDATTKTKVQARLKRAAGQVAGVQRMVDDDRYCVDVIQQISAVRAALGKVSEMMLAQHMETCVSHAFESDDPAERRAKIDELLAVFTKASR